MGRKGSRYALEEKLKCIKLVQSGASPWSVQQLTSIKQDQVKQWIERFEKDGVKGLYRRSFHHYTKEFKLKVVQSYLNGEGSLLQLVRKYDISNTGLLYQWISRYTCGKSLTTTRSAGIMKNGRKTTQTERIEIAQWTIAHELDYQQAIAKFDVSYGQVYGWVRKFNAEGNEGLKDRRGRGKTIQDSLSDEERKDLEIKQLKARLDYLSTENAVLKKLQKFERGVAQTKPNISPFKHSKKK